MVLSLLGGWKWCWDTRVEREIRSTMILVSAGESWDAVVVGGWLGCTEGVVDFFFFFSSAWMVWYFGATNRTETASDVEWINWSCRREDNRTGCSSVCSTWNGGTASGLVVWMTCGLMFSTTIWLDWIVIQEGIRTEVGTATMEWMTYFTSPGIY